MEAIDFLRTLNTEVYQRHSNVQTIAEESTAWPMVSRPIYVGGLGFGMKWDMGWMHDTLEYMSQDPIYRKFRHAQLTFRMAYAFNENFCLPLSHDEVVYGKGSLLGKMPGDGDMKLANLRLLYGYMYGMPGKKLIFMGGELGQSGEWQHDGSLDWNALEQPSHAALMNWLAALNRVYTDEQALHQGDCDPAGFQWIDANASEQSVVSFLRKAKTTKDLILVVCNFTPVLRTKSLSEKGSDPLEASHFHYVFGLAGEGQTPFRIGSNYRLGVPRGGYWREILNSDAADHGGSGYGNLGGAEAIAVHCHGRPFSLNLTVPPFASVFLKWQAGA